MLRLAALLLLIPTVALADITGSARVIDGDTIEIAGQRIRLHGIDAFERAQTCGGEAWPCGARATRWLTAILRGHEVKCEVTGTSYDRKVAVCITGGPLTLGHLLVRLGLALADPIYGRDYLADEAWARKHHKGAWSHRKFVTPWEWRRGKRLTKSDVPPPWDCPIKGNINSKGERIYHVPGGRWYGRTMIDPGRGERWFCTEDEARRAGWRPTR